MLRRLVAGAAVIALAMATAATLLAATDAATTFLDLIFAGILAWCAVGVFRLVWHAARRARVERRTARRLESTTLLQAAHGAVVEERVRLAADIEALVRGHRTAS